MTDCSLDRRFSGVAKIYGEAALQTFQQSHICIIGLGGVGSWVVEALARSAIGKMTLIDLDNVAESNINRQLQATSETLGKAKTQALRERVLSINPDCQIIEIEEFITPDNLSKLISSEFNWVIDCIDNFRAKAALIHYCKRQKIKIMTMGGAGGMTDPSKIQIADLSRTKQDPLLSKVRKLLRQDYNFPSNPARRFNIPCVYSEEHLKYPDGDGGITQQKPQFNRSGLNCAGGFGSSVCVTAPFGFYAVSYILNNLAVQ